MNEYRIVRRGIVSEGELTPALPQEWKDNIDEPLWRDVRFPGQETWRELNALAAIMDAQENNDMQDVFAGDNSELILQMRKIAAKVGRVSLMPYTRWKEVISITIAETEFKLMLLDEPEF
jgi:hypothetical protein